MRILYSKVSVLFFIFISAFCFNTSIFANDPIKIDTVLTDKMSDDNPGPATEAFTKDTPMIYIAWKSDQLKEGQTIKGTWIAEDTNNAAPPNYKIDEATLTLTKDFKAKMLSTLPGSYWGGKFSMSKPNNGWPVGKYRIDISVDGTIVKTIKFTVGDTSKTPAATATSAQPKNGNWGAIAVDDIAGETSPAYGTGGGSSKNEAETNAKKFCSDGGGKQCKIMVSYQECGAFAISAKSTGKGIGATKKLAEEKAKIECKDSSCQIVTSDCNE